MSELTTLTSKGQVTVPHEIRSRMGLKPGDKIAFSLLPDGTLVIRPKHHHIEELTGLLRRPGQPRVSLEKMRVELGVEEETSGT